MENFSYKKSYHKIAGRSMKLYSNYIDQYCGAIHQSLICIKKLYIPYEYFWLYGFIDDTNFYTTLPVGEESIQTELILEKVLVSKDYLSIIFLLLLVKYIFPNGVVGSISVTSLQQNKDEVINMSCLNLYLYFILIYMTMPVFF